MATPNKSDAPAKKSDSTSARKSDSTSARKSDTPKHDADAYASASSEASVHESVAAREPSKASERAQKNPVPVSAPEREDAPEGNAPAPEVPTEVVIDPSDRATYVGPPNTTNEEGKYPDDVGDEDKDGPKPKQVEFFQLYSSNGAVVLRFDNHAVALNAQQALALSGNLRSAMANVTY